MSAGKILESAMTTAAGSAHVTLLQRPEGAYTRLVTAQKFREQATEDDSDSETDVAPAGLTREQVDEMARNEKPQFENIKRVGTGRSAASLELEARNLRDLSGSRPKNHSFWYLFSRLLAINSESKWDYVLGLA